MRNKEELAEYLNDFFNNYGFNQRDLSRKSKISFVTINNIVKGKIDKTLRAKTVLALEKAVEELKKL